MSESAPQPLDPNSGATTRTRIAAQMAAALVSRDMFTFNQLNEISTANRDKLVRLSVKLADSLMAELDVLQRPD